MPKPTETTKDWAKIKREYEAYMCEREERKKGHWFITVNPEARYV
jgi:hypothetical protein